LALRKLVEALRNFRGENGIPPKQEFPLAFVASSDEVAAFVLGHEAELRALARVSALRRLEAGTPAEPAEAVLPLGQPAVELRISLKGLVNVEEEARRLRKEIEKVSGDLKFVTDKLARESFVSRAPTELVEKERAREAEFRGRLQELERALARLTGLGS
jgi:valyl-tRNA synthetase